MMGSANSTTPTKTSSSQQQSQLLASTATTNQVTTDEQPKEQQKETKQPAARRGAPDFSDDELRANGTFVPLVLYQGGMGYNDQTKALFKSIGGMDAIIGMTTIFYQKFEADQHIKQFLGTLQTPLEIHARRIGMYFCEMMGMSGDPWSTDVNVRPKKAQPLANGRSIVVDSRQAAHAAAWNSKTRKPQDGGKRFKLDDCRVWMRLMFWACRESGLAENPAFFSYYQRWIGHFIPVYEQTAAEFVRAEARWSASENRIARYFQDGCMMKDVVGVPYHKAIESLPPQERGDDNWAYEHAINSR